MRMIDVTKRFATEDQCLDYLEQMRWPNGLCCVHCGVTNVSKIIREATGKNKRTRIYQCLEKECGKQFSATSGTIFSDTHLPLTKWFLAIALICEAKKGMSAKQLERHLGVNYRTAWHLAHRIREAMQDGGGLLTGVVETDEIADKREARQPNADLDAPLVLAPVETGCSATTLHSRVVPRHATELTAVFLEHHSDSWPAPKHEDQPSARGGSWPR